MVQSGVCSSDTSSVATVNVGTALVAPRLTGVEQLSATSLQLTFSGPAGQTYKVCESADVTQLLSSWNVLASGIFGSGPATYIDSNATNTAQFYRISLP